jgi:type II secretory pathway component GspD/PulD (secretin)
MRSTITVVDGQAANFHVGDKYPIPTAQFSGLTVGGIGSAPPVNFEDLGIVMKVTPSIHSMDEVSLDLEAEFKALGTTTSNGIPTISDKKLQAKVRLNTSDWIVVAGLVSRSDTVTLNGLPGLSTLPVIGGLFRSNMKATDFSEALVLVKVNVLSMPPDEDKVTRALWVGSDTRWRTVL